MLSYSTTGQEQHFASFIDGDPSWSSEFIPFPITWAPEMTIAGYEELRFSPDWSDQKSTGFWSLCMGWNITSNHLLEETEIIHNLTAYYKGLMKPNHWATEFPDPVITLHAVAITEEVRTYRGGLHVFDGFHTGKMITLYIKATQVYHKADSKTFIIITFSPQPFDHKIWQELGRFTRKE